MTAFSPRDVEEYFGRLGIPAHFTPDEASRLAAAPPADRPGFLLFPTPEDNGALTILALRERIGVDPARQPAFFDHPWYLNEAFGQVPCTAGWHAVRMEVLAESAAKPVYYADQLKRRGLFLPSATEVIIMLFLHFTATGERLLLRKHTWTRDRTEAGRFVSVGAFGKKGVFVSSHEVGYGSRGLGICPVVDPFARTGAE